MNDIVKQASLMLSDINIENIDPNPNNPNTMSDAEINRLVEAIKEDGFLVPIITIKHNDRYKILNGEHRWRASMIAGLKYIPAIVLMDEKYNDPDYIDLLNIRLNEIRGGLDAVKFKPTYEKVVTKYGEQEAKKVLGITHDEVYKKMIKKMAIQLKKNMSDDMAEKIDKAVERSKNPESFVKTIAKIISNESKSVDITNCVIFQFSGKEHVIVRCNQNTFSVIQEISRMCLQSGRDINEVIYDALNKVVSDFHNQFKDVSIEIPPQ